MYFLKYKLLKPFIITPSVICITPKMTANFIFILLTKLKLLGLFNQMGSTPKEYTQSGFLL